MLPVEAAAIWSLLGGYLLLPSATSVDVSLLPPLDKFSIPAISTFLLCWMKGTQAPAPARPLLIYCLAFAFVVTPIFTSLNNSYELEVGGHSIAGFYPLDGVKLAIQNLITLAPLFIGMRFFSSHNGRALLLKSLPTAALFYSLPMLFEIKMSPQLHRWVYGFFPHSFAQQFRDGGFRPVVFLGHGLEVSLFASIAVIAAVIAARARWHLLRMRAGAAATYLAVVLLLCKSLASTVYAAVVAPLVLLTTPRTWVRVACAVLLLVCAYPMLRSFNLIPVHRIAETANVISADRSSSFETRVKNEDVLLAKANEKPFFGWGAWGRNRVYDATSGADVSVTDGQWIVQLGVFGWIGYLSLFGLFVTAVMRARMAVRGPVTQGTIVVGGLSLLLAVTVLDLIPNANQLQHFMYVVAGSLAVCVRARATQRSAQRRVSGSQPAVVVPQ